MDTKSELKEESILISGGSGYIGGSFAYHLSKTQPALKLIIIDNCSNGRHVNLEISQFYQCDIADIEQLAKILKAHSIKTVFHFSAFLEVNESLTNPLKYYENNVAKGILFLKTCLENGVTNFVFSSSAAVYGAPRYFPIDENHPTDPITPYGKTKLMFEEILRDVANARKDFNYVSLRYFNVAGSISKKILHGESHLLESHLIPKILDVALGIQHSITIFGSDYDTPDGTCLRDFIDIKDLCEAHGLAWNFLTERKKSAVINLGTEKGTSVKEIINLVQKVTQREIPIKLSGRREGDPPALIASNKKARELLNWAPRRALEKTIARAWTWHLLKYGVMSHYLGFNLYDLITRFKGVLANKEYFSGDYQNTSADSKAESQRMNENFEVRNEHCFRVFFAPGRINLIGEHVDYNGGLVMPCAINRGTYIVCRLNNSSVVNFYSDFYSELISYDLSKRLSDYPKKGNWADYVLGSLIQLGKHFELAKGFDAFIWGNMPMAAGMSSSASLTVAVITATIEIVNPLFNSENPKREEIIARMAQTAESEFVGVPCGIMDQFIVANARRGEAMLLDCDTLAFQSLPVNLAGHCFLLCNTNLRRENRSGKYKERVLECQRALGKLQNYKNFPRLANFEGENLEKLLGYLEGDEVLIARTKHVISENRRVRRAFEALRCGRLEEFGELLTESGRSLKNEFGVSGRHLDWMVEAALICEGVLGARMMGAGFGGCALVLASRAHLGCIKEMVARIYSANSGIEPTFYEFELDEGAREIVL